jgi:tetratricopeptide (TPR) repeat protein
LRLARHLDLFDELAASDDEVPSSGKAAWENEKAAAQWHRGRATEARALWLNQADSVPVLFNRGMAALFLGEVSEARSALEQAVSQIPETSAWHHLGRLYQTLAEARQ